MNLSTDQGKKAAAMAAVNLIEDGMVIGLGTGSTASYFIRGLAERCREGLKVTAVASSKQSEELALSLQVPIVDIDTLTSLDLVVDGADEIDPQKQMIKGGGGALLREKIIATMSREMVVIVDASKCVQTLGAFPLPIEILPFASRATLFHLQKLGLQGHMRQCKDGALFVTDNGNYIYDIHEGLLNTNLEHLNEALLSIPGVLETGLFLNLAGRVFVGTADGHVDEL
jgi:ribose 5-phosphate isomerase A